MIGENQADSVRLLYIFELQSNMSRKCPRLDLFFGSDVFRFILKFHQQKALFGFSFFGH